MPSAVIIRARLPAGLERIRRKEIADARDGVPAHLTMLYPFVEADGLDRRVRRTIEAVARRHRPFPYRLARIERWPDTIYVAVDPEEPFVRLQADLASAFPEQPIHGQESDLEFVPHISISEAKRPDLSPVRRILAARPGPPTERATALEVIATAPNGAWRTLWRIRLG
jgi:2'-5' RNA ligase